MKRNPWLKYLPVILASSCLAFVALKPAYPADIPGVQLRSDYDSYMRSGYTATAKRDYRAALINFRRALSERPGDRYALNAVGNVSKYLARRGDSSLSFVPPNLGAPGSRQGGATRGGCNSENQFLTALVPATNIGTTTAEYPEVFFYVPQTQVQTMEFALLDENDNQIGKTNVAPSLTPGIVSVRLSALKNLKPLEIGKKYHWYMSIICDARDRSTDVFVDGWIQRIEVDPVLASELKKATPGDRVSLYAVNGIWYDTLQALSQTRQSSPTNSVLAGEWGDLLKSVGLEKIAREPLVQCCTARK